MDFGIRDNKLPFGNIEQTNSPDNSSAAQEEKKIQSGIVEANDSIEAISLDSVFTSDATAGSVNFGDGVQGKKLPENQSDIQDTYRGGTGEVGNIVLESLLIESQSEIHNYLNGREDSLTPRGDAASAKIQLDNQKIDSQMENAEQKADLAMEQATAALVTGVIAGGLTITTVLSGLQSFADSSKSEIAQGTDGIAGSQLESRYQRLSSLLTQHANEMEIEMKRLENQADKTDDAAKSSEDQNQKIRDAILDFLRKLGELNPKI